MASGGGVNTDILSDETFDLLCTMCKRKDRNHEAEKYCVECHDYYCLTCVKVHDDVPSLNGHNILDKGQFPSGSSQALPMAPTERCDRHSHKHVDMYCQNHDEIGCSTCMAVDHRLCQDTFYIPDFLQNSANTSTSADIQRKLDSAAKSLIQQHDTLQQEKQQLLKRKTDTLEKIRKFRKEINDRLDELEKISVDGTENKCKALISEIEKAIGMLQTNKALVQSAKDKLSSPCNNKSQTFVNVKKGNQIANMACKCADENKVPIEDIVFKADQKLPALLEEMNALGVIKQKNVDDEGDMFTTTSVTRYQKDSFTQITRNKKYPSSGNNQQGNVLLRVVGKKKYKVKVQSDKYNCDIVSACALEDGTIILTDYKNKKLKRLNGSTYTVTDYCDLSDEPWQVCPTSKQEVAVCFRNIQIAQFISVENKMTKTKEIKTDFTCMCIAYANGNLYLSDDDTSVYIYSVSGSKLKQFSKHQSGQNLFSDICSLAACKDGSKIYVSDCNKGLIVLDSNGQVVGRFNGPQLKQAYDCHFTDTGSLLVCGRYSHNVLQFGPDGELIREVVKSVENTKYQAVCCNQQMSKMIVGSESNDIEVCYLDHCNSQ